MARRHAALACLVLPWLGGCGSLTGMLWRDEFDPQYVVVGETRVLPADAFLLGADHGPAVVALRVDGDDLPRAWRDVVMAGHALAAGEKVVLECAGGGHAALAHYLLAAPPAGDGVELAGATLSARVGADAGDALPVRARMVLAGSVPRARVVERLSRAEVERRHPGLADLLEAEDNTPGYALAARAFMNQPWLDWLGAEGPPEVQNRLLEVFDRAGAPLPADRRERVARAFAHDAALTVEEIREVDGLTAVGRVIDGEGGTACYVAVPVPSLLLLDKAGLQLAGDRVKWVVESDWLVEPRRLPPAGATARGRAAGLERVELVLQVRKRVRMRGNSVVVKVLLTPVAVFADCVTCFLAAAIFGDDDDDEWARDCHR